MRWPGSFIAAALVVGIAGPSSAGQVQLTIRDGLVTLEAKDATLREILAEWARVGQTRVVNGESVAGGPLTLQLTDVPERRALDTLLRSAAGFIAAPRPVLQPSLSTYDRIVLMPGVRPAAVPGAAQAASPTTGFQYHVAYPAWQPNNLAAGHLRRRRERTRPGRGRDADGPIPGPAAGDADGKPVLDGRGTIRNALGAAAGAADLGAASRSADGASAADKVNRAWRPGVSEVVVARRAPRAASRDCPTSGTGRQCG